MLWKAESHVSEPQATIQPIYADRASGQTFPDARAMVNAYLTRFGERAGAKLESLDASGYTLVRKGSASVGINVLEDHGVILFVAPVMPVPVTGRETFYRKLLDLSFLATSDAAFAVDAQRDEVVVRALRRLSGLDYERVRGRCSEPSARWRTNGTILFARSSDRGEGTTFSPTAVALFDAEAGVRLSCVSMAYPGNPPANRTRVRKRASDRRPQMISSG